ncbi:hypothetical protein [Pedobacter sp. B4-66]|uniref:hypothetical protein n=1 Tax=Pedobacter sp. B4-66 TaxID=2817280 RepID=UPI001BDAFA92|nr:hypothetical protein [Pedobacter sp. B4-66]
MKTNNVIKIDKRPIRLFLPILLLSIATLLGMVYSCKKSNAAPVDTEGDYGNHPRSTVPDELVGYWIAGVSSIGNFWGYDGSYQGPANEIAVGYMLYKDGRAKEYFYYTSTSTYCRTQVLGYKEGTVKIDPAAKTFEMFYASGNYRSFNTCGSSNPPGFGESKKYTSAELYPAKKMLRNNWRIQEINGKKVLVVPIGDGEEQYYEKSTEPQK